MKNQGSRIRCSWTRHKQGRSSMVTTRELLSAPPNPRIVWYSFLSSTTMSAPAIGPGDVKLIGEGNGSFLNNLDLSHVVCHCRLEVVMLLFSFDLSNTQESLRTTSRICCETARWANPTRSRILEVRIWKWSRIQNALELLMTRSYPHCRWQQGDPILSNLYKYFP